jgi:predicted transcriptional regulator
LVHEYRDRIYIRKGVLLKLYEYGELNQSKLMSYCDLNNVKHGKIIEEMAKKEIILRTEEAWGNKTIIK